MAVDEVAKWDQRSMRAGTVFTPNTPINAMELFAGRRVQANRVIDAVNQIGQHAILFGERGVGKTSLASVLSQFLPSPSEGVIAPRVNCDGSDTFPSLWRKVFEQVDLMRARPVPGFTGEIKAESYKSSDLLPQQVTPDGVRRALTLLSGIALPIIIIDELDRLGQKPRRALADTVKNLSDHGVPATLVLVGVGDSVDELIQEHESISRALVQIQVPRMSESEIREIIKKGASHLGMTVEDSAMDRITLLAQGLPHYAHLIGLNATRAALESKSDTITLACIDRAIEQALRDAQQSVRSAYLNAVRSARKDNLFSVVLLSCALAKVDEAGTFAAQDVRKPMREITGKVYDIPSYAQHLKEFSDSKRGMILTKTGERRRYRFRFTDPLMQPFVIMQGVVENKIPDAYLGRVGT